MNNLVKIENINGVNVVSSRIIAEQLGKEHSKVIRSLEQLLTEPNVASLILPNEYKDKKGEMRKEYLLTKDGFTLYMFNIQGHNDFKMAYINKFNEMENIIKQNLTPAQQLLAQAQFMVDLENRVNQQQSQITRLEHNIRRTMTDNHLTVIAYANMNNIHPKSYNSSAIGRKATALCVQRNLSIGRVVDSKYGYINTYPIEILNEIFFKR